MTLPNSATSLSVGHPTAHDHVYDVKAHFGGVADGSTDDTAAIVAADAAAGSEMATLLLQAGRWKFSTFAPTGPRRLLGVGWSATPNAVFGSGTWTGSGEGTVLVSTATSGIAIDLASTYDRFGIEHLMVLGPGSGTATGIRSGGATGVTPMSGGMNDVGVANFATGITLNGVNDALFSGLVLRGCSTGLEADYFNNQNTFLQTEVQFASVNAIHMKATAGTGGATQNNFYGGLVQNCTSNGIRAAGNENNFYGFWLENSGITTGAIVSGTGNGLHDIHIANDNSKNITLSGNGNFLSRFGGAPSVITMSGIQNTIISNNAAVTDSGSQNNIITGNGGANIFGGATTFADATFNPLQLDNGASSVPIKIAGNTTALVYPGASANTRLWVFSASVQVGPSNTAGRPSAANMGAGAIWYDTTLSKPIFSNGSVWKDAAGTTV